MNLINEIKKSVRQNAKGGDADADWVKKYLGTKRKYICLKSKDRDGMIKKYLKDLKVLGHKEVIQILDGLFSSDTFEDYNLAGKMLIRLPEVSSELKMDQIKKWVSRSNGWAECDSICQSLFDEKEVLGRWSEWQEAIIEFSKDKNIQIRRASLVLQCKPNRKSTNPKFHILAFETVDRLKTEENVLVTKAISWLLREMSSQNPQVVRQYLDTNKDSLPKIAYRETMKKIKTGRK